MDIYFNLLYQFSKYDCAYSSSAGTTILSNSVQFPSGIRCNMYLK